MDMNVNMQQITTRVMSKHNRKVSQLEGLTKELGLHFDEEEAANIARQTMKKMHPNQTAHSSQTIDAIVSKARKEHTRKVSQFQAIKHDIGQYLPDDIDASKMAAEVMREVNPNDRSGKTVAVSVDEVLHNAMTQHKRKVSQFRAIESGLNDFGYGADDVKSIAKDFLKGVFAQKARQHEIERKQEERAFRHVRADSVKAPDLFGDQNDSDEENGNGDSMDKRRGSKVFLDDEALAKRKARADWKRKESLATPNLFGDADGGDALKGADGLRHEIGRLKSALSAKEKEIDWMREVISDLAESKTELARESNRCMEQMRQYLLLYQKSIEGRATRNNNV